MPKGVFIDKRRKKKKYGVRIGRPKEYFATVAEPVAAHKSYRAGKLKKRATARAALAGKRARNLAIYGRNSATERKVALALVARWQATIPGRRTALVLNDGTKADVLLRLSEEDAWLPVQLKTTSGAKKGEPNMWYFHNVTGYSGMCVVCWRCDVGDAWVYNGNALNERGKLDLSVTPLRKNCELALARGLNLAALVQWLSEQAQAQAHLCRWTTVTEHAARHDFASEVHAVEMRGIDAFKASFPKHRYAFPEGQNTQVDLLKDATTRQQFKTARAASNGAAGFMCNLYTYAGRDEAGKQMKDPYPAGAFDELVAVAWVEDKAYFWIIPAAELEAKGYLQSESQPGKTCLKLHASQIGVQPNPHARNKADTWTHKYFHSAA
ncbi:hypothetical protein HOP50_04g28410 [Chloropicon primus]|uniref:Uncharacterized protein n=1 Tax=Chloropicon primus TaxID=1764295 RepID=A0A5B8MIQ6_9CHLO|nr:hypothetical protein A3770_04p28410 [Chloropicon primus]UPQ99533.1 hypothetical protein HOP50_04g28410 [Chloropicon primus]|eukprot:QDZ20323.1 hypothetical protein A3770_04p28410 [Chloropicon primus]